MKFLFFPLLLLLLPFSFISCSILSEEEKGDNEAGTIVYTSLCGFGEAHWLDNETILYDDHCDGTIKKINIITKAVQLIRFNQDSLPVSTFYTQQIPGILFYFLPNSLDPLKTKIDLHARHLTTGKSTLLKQELPGTYHPIGTLIGKKKIGISSESGVVIVDLESGASQETPATGFLKAFSPDDSKIVVYPASPIDPTDALVYDLTCQCSEPSPYIGTQGLIWRAQGVYGYKASYSWGINTLQFLNALTGDEVKTYPTFLSGPWISPGSTLAVIWISTTQNITDQKGLLVSFDLATQSTKELYTGVCCTAAFDSDVKEVSFSPDQKKIAVVKGNQVRLLYL